MTLKNGIGGRDQGDPFSILFGEPARTPSRIYPPKANLSAFIFPKALLLPNHIDWNKKYSDIFRPFAKRSH